MVRDVENDFRVKEAERLTDIEKAKAESKGSAYRRVKPGDIKLSEYDLAKIRNDARKRFGKLLQIISSVSQVNEVIKSNEIKDFDDGVLAGRAKIFKDIKELGTYEYNRGVREVDRGAREKSKKTGKEEKGC